MNHMQDTTYSNSREIFRAKLRMRFRIKYVSNQGSTDQNRLVQDQAVRSGPRTRPDQDQKFLRNLGPDRTRTGKI